MKVKLTKVTNKRAEELVLQLQKLGKLVENRGHRSKKPIRNLRSFLSIYGIDGHLLNFHI